VEHCNVFALNFAEGLYEVVVLRQQQTAAAAATSSAAATHGERGVLRLEAFAIG